MRESSPRSSGFRGTYDHRGVGMNEFSFVSAWSLGYRFVAARPLQHIALLIGIGLLLPFALQFAVGGLTQQAELHDGGEGAAAGVLGLVLLAISYMLQSGALFAVLRLGLGDRETFGRALVFGLVAGLLATGTAAVLFVVAVMAAGQFGPPGIALFVILATLIPVIVALATWSTLWSALLGVGCGVALVLTMLFSATTGDLGFAATWLGGGSGFVVVLLLVLSVVLVWLAGRLSCTAAIMADRGSVNLIAAMRASWELTAEEQWRITLYLAIVGLGGVILLVAAAAALGGSAVALQEVASPTVAGAGAALVMILLVAVPFAYLTALVPAGIFRQLAGERAPVEVFA